LPFDEDRLRLEREAPLFELLEREELFEFELRDLLRDVPDPEFPRAIRLSSWATCGHGAPFCYPDHASSNALYRSWHDV